MNRPEDGKPARPALKPDTQVTVGGRNPQAHHGYVNPPVYHASTQLYRTAQDYIAHDGPYFYGRLGTPTSEALEKAIQEIEGQLAPAWRSCRPGLRRFRRRFSQCSNPATIS
jgi:cystathionine beta-lyase